MWYGHHGPWCFGFFIFFLAFVFLLVRLFIFRKRGYCHRWTDEAETILRKRLVNGEITEEEYLKLKNTLKK